VDAAYAQLFAQPGGEIRPKAARIDKVIANFAEIEAARSEKEIAGVHRVALLNRLVLYHDLRILGCNSMGGG
jgi:hypothetical protein